MDNTLVVVAGPTAVGKTGCGIDLARHYQTEIISADSRQIFRESCIGTAVPAAEELQKVKHHFIQTVSLGETYNASRFEFEVLETLSRLFEKRSLVLMVGGSGLYIDAVCRGIDDLPSSDPELRKVLHERLEKEGLDILVAELASKDPVSHQKIDLKNPMRVMKALEVTLQTGKPYSSFLSERPKTRPFRILRLALDLERTELYERINRRVDVMMEAGLLEEVRSLLPYRDATSMKTVGYRELFRHLNGELTLEEAIDLIKRNTRKYARKQITWFRKDQLYTWFSPSDLPGIIRWIDNQLRE